MTHLARLILCLCLIAVAAIPVLAEQVRVIPRGSVTVPAGQTTADIPVVIQGDTVVEPDEGYTVTISSPTLQLGTATATGTIINDDGIVAPVLSVSAPARVKNGTVANFTVTRAGDKSKADRVQWAIVPISGTPANETDFPAVLEDDFSGSALGADWCAADGSSATYEAPDGCPGIPEDAQYGLWEADRISVSGGSLRLGIDHDAGNWTAAQVFSKRAFFGGQLEYGVNFPAGKGGAHAIWRSPADHYYGPGPRSGQIVDVAYFGKEAGQRNKTWLSQLQYSGPDSTTFPAIAGLLNDGTVWSGTSRAGVTRWRVGTDGVMRFSFRIGNTEYWAPVQGDWPATQPWTVTGVDEFGGPETIVYPGGGAQSPFDRPFRIVMQSGVGGADSVACSGETDCPDSAVLDGAVVAIDYVRLYQYPNGQAIFQPGQDQITIPVQTRDAALAGVRSFRLVLMSADEAAISAANGSADVALDPTGTVGVDHGSETYFLDFGLNAGGFTDEFGTTWANGNGFVTGGTASSDVTSGGVGAWTTALHEPPTMDAGYVTVSNKCPGDAGWPSAATLSGKDLKIVWPTDRDCSHSSTLFPIQGPDPSGAEPNDPIGDVWIVGGKLNFGLSFRRISGDIYVEGTIIDQKCKYQDAFNSYWLSGSGQKMTIVNSHVTGIGYDDAPGGTHGDTVHPQGSGSMVGNLRLQNVYAHITRQGVFTPPRFDGSYPGHGARRMELDTVFLQPDPVCKSSSGKGVATYLYWGESPWGPTPDGVTFKDTYIQFGGGAAPAQVPGSATIPTPSGFDTNKCANYAAAAKVLSGKWCQGQPPKGAPVPLDKIGRAYDRAYFAGGSGEPPNIKEARVPRLDHTRLTGSTMQIAIPVNTLRGRQRLVTLGFSARDETAAGQRVFDIAGNIARKGFDIYANAGARDTETRITAPVTVGEDGFMRLTLTGVTGNAQINWMSIQRPTVSVTLDKAAYVEGDTVTATLRRNGPTEPSVSMGWQVLGAGDAPTTASDFDPQGPSGTAFWEAGDVDRTASFQIRQDGAGEPQESFIFALSGGTGADIDPALSSVTATIAASSGPSDPCAPGGVSYPCDGGGNGGGEDPTDVCRPEGALTGKPIRIEAGKAIAVRKTHLVSGLNGVMRGLQTKCTKSTVCYGRESCIDPKGLQADVPSTAFVRIDTAGAFPSLQPGQVAKDSFVYTVCAPPLFTTCTPVIADVIITAPN